MKNKYKRKDKLIYSLKPLLIVVFFLFWSITWADDLLDPNPGEIIINELMWMGMGDSNSDEWIELFNPTDTDLSLSPCHIVKKDGKDIVKTNDLKDKVIKSEDFMVISYKDKDSSKIDTSTNKILSSQALSNSELEIKLICNDIIIDKAGDGEKPLAGENDVVKKSMERNEDVEDGSKKESWHTCYKAINLDDDSVDCATPGKENSQQSNEEDDEEENEDENEEPEEYSKAIKITELLPNPEEKEEYIELYNPENKTANLRNYYLKDASKNGKYVFPDDSKKSEIPGKSYLTITKSEFAFALNNSGEEALALFAPDDTLIDVVTYNGTKKGLSYSFDGMNWHWTRYLTPKKDNRFDSPLSFTVFCDKEACVGMYVNCSLKNADKRIEKVTWDFGDGSRSHIRSTKHKYKKTGIYQASVKVSGKNLEETRKFTIEVNSYPKTDVRIIAISPNPSGKDSGHEWLLLENNSDKKINLKDWGIASGTSKLYNHPIKKDFVIKEGDVKKLTRKYCAFTLSNTKTKLELRSPDGKTVQKISYSKNKIESDETYEKVGKKWEWIKSEIPDDENASETTVPPPTEENGEVSLPTEETLTYESSPVETENESVSNIILTDEEITAAIGQATLSPEWEEKRKNRIRLSVAPARPLLSPEQQINSSFVLGIEKVKETDNHYYFTDLSPSIETHWIKVFYKNSLIKINRLLRDIIMNIF